MNGKWDEQAHYYNDGDQYVWTPAEGIGRQIGICGEDANKGYGLAIYEIAGDEARIFLYTAPRKFYSGGAETRLWMQDGVILGLPTAEMVSSVTLVSESEDSTQRAMETIHDLRFGNRIFPDPASSSTQSHIGEKENPCGA